MEFSLPVVRVGGGTGGFAGNRGHDPHLLYTTSAVQLLAIYGELDRIDRDKVARRTSVVPARRCRCGDGACGSSPCACVLMLWCG